jgi:hypothetical protein
LQIAQPDTVFRAPGRAEAEVSVRRAAIVADTGLLALAVLAVAAVSLFDGLVVDTDAATTARKILEHEQRFRLVGCAFVLGAVLDVVVA